MNQASAIIFDHPWVLAGFAVVIPLVLGDRLSPRGKRFKKNLPDKLWAKLSVSRLFFWLFLACLIIALAGPRWGLGQAPGEYRRAVDAVIALDVSRSMELRDGGDAGNTGAVSRMERGMEIVRETIAAMPEMRFAVTLSRNRGIVAIPLTRDSDAVLAFLEAADGSSLTGRGTNLESLLDASAGAFQASQHSNRIIILVSDGEALSGSMRAAVGRCSRDSIAVTTVAVGSDEGSEVPGASGVASGIISRRDSNAMRAAASETGGIFVDGNHEDAVGTLATYLRSLASPVEIRRNSSERKAHWFLFAMLAIMCFGASRLSLLRMRNEQ